MNGDPELLHPSIETLLPLVPGTLAPDFTLHSTPDETVSLPIFVVSQSFWYFTLPTGVPFQAMS
jgi:hypothetical protein